MRVSSLLGVLLALILAASAVDAATPLTALNGEWQGGGTDRDGPLAAPQPTHCRATIKTDPTHLTSTTQCDGETGLAKSFRLSVAFTGDRFTGSVEQVSSVHGGPVTRYAGTVSGRRDGDVASFTARFGGLTPSAYVVLTLTSPTAYAMRVRVLGSTLTDVTLRRR